MASTPGFAVSFVLRILSFGLPLLVGIRWDIFHVSITEKQLPERKVERGRCLTVVF
jgi:hypothetical protein